MCLLKLALLLLAVMGVPRYVSVSAQSVPPDAWACQEFDPRALQTVACNVFLEGTEVWTAPSFGVTQQFLYTQMLDPRPPLNISILQPLQFMPPDCAAAYMRLSCSAVFMNCVTVDDVVSFSGPCRSVCEDANFQCAAFLAANGFPPVDCSVYVADNDTLSCHTPDADRSSNFEMECPHPLEFNPDGDPFTGLACSIVCLTYAHLGLGTEDDLKTAETVATALGAISTACLIIVFLTYVIFPTAREFPRRIVMFICIPLIYTELAMTMNSWTSRKDFYCEDNFTWRGTNGFCAATAWMIYWAGMTTALWWTCQSFVLFWNVALLKQPRKLVKWEPVMHIVCWGIPLITAILTLAIPGTSFRSGFPYCADDHESIGWIWGTVHSILFLCLFLVCIMVVCCMIRLFRSSTLDQTIWTRWKYQIQLMIFTMTYFISVLSFLIFRFWADTGGLDDVADSFPGWYACVFAGGGDDCQLETTVDKGIYYFQLYSLTTLGIWTFLVFFVLNTYNRNLWYLGFLNLREGRPFLHNPSSTTSGRSGARSSSESGDGGGSEKRRTKRQTLRHKMAEDKPDM